MKKMYAILILLITLIAHSSFAKDLQITLNKITVPPGARDISFIDNLGGNFIVDDDLEMKIDLGLCSHATNSKSIPDLASRCRNLVSIGYRDVPANLTSKPVTIIPNDRFETPLSINLEKIRAFSPTTTIASSIKDLKIFAYDEGADQEMLAVTDLSLCFYQIFFQGRKTACPLKASGTLILDFTVQAIE